jgi:nucleoid DNA-binding protein
MGRNPKNSEKIQIPEKKAIRWKMSKIFFKRLNKNFTENEISDTY